MSLLTMYDNSKDFLLCISLVYNSPGLLQGLKVIRLRAGKLHWSFVL